MMLRVMRKTCRKTPVRKKEEDEQERSQVQRVPQSKDRTA
jgi:hypothetical protein